MLFSVPSKLYVATQQTFFRSTRELGHAMDYSPLTAFYSAEFESHLLVLRAKKVDT